MCEVLSFPNFAKKIRHASIHIIPLFYNHKNECVPTKKYYHAQLIFLKKYNPAKCRSTDQPELIEKPFKIFKFQKELI